MTSIRYQLADFISGGELTFQREGWKRSAAQSEDRFQMFASAFCEASDMKRAMTEIEQATRGGKSGTARKINRMAREALR